MTDQILSMALTAHNLGNFQQAESLYKEVLKASPGHPQAHHNLGIIAITAGQIHVGLEHLRRALVSQPNQPTIWLSYIKGLMASAQTDLARQTLVHAQAQGLIGKEVDFLAEKLQVRMNVPDECVTAIAALVAVGQIDQARKAAQKLVGDSPSLPQAWTALGAVCRREGKVIEALEAFSKAYDLEPKNIAYLCNFASAKFDEGEFQESFQLIQSAIELNPNFSDGWYIRGNCLNQLGDISEAIISYQKAVELNPSALHAKFNLAKLLQAKGDIDQAIEAFGDVIAINPHQVEAVLNLSEMLRGKNRLNEAEVLLNQAFQINSEDSSLNREMAQVKLLLKKNTEAIFFAKKSIEIMPYDSKNHLNYGAILVSVGERIEGEQAILKSKELALFNLLKLEPNNPGIYSNLGVFYGMNGNLSDAIKYYRRAIELQPDFLPANENLLCALAWQCVLGPLDYLNEAKKWESRVISSELKKEALERQFSNETIRNRAIRIGYVSGDFREHAVSYFIESVIKYHNSNGVEVYCYSNSQYFDEISEQIKSHSTKWVEIFSLADDEVARIILNDKIDVLIDLSGYTGLNRMGLFSRRIAPVQAHYLGFFASTGNSQMDYFIGDSTLIPKSHDNHFSEKIFRLNRVYLAYKNLKNLPPCVPQTNEKKELLFGSFNQLSKITLETIELWSRVLQKIPQSKLLIKTKALNEPLNKKILIDKFEKEGISSNRLELRGGTDGWEEHMATYNQLDIALDPFGAQGGATTTCDALAMGVPVVTLAGDRLALRMTASLLMGLNHSEWIANTGDEYVAIIQNLVSDRIKLMAIRNTLQSEFFRSSLSDSKGMAKALEDAYKQMFNSWCDSHQLNQIH